MAPKAVEAEQKGGKSRAEKKPVKTKAEKKPVKKEGSKKKKAKSIETYKIYIYKVLKQVNSFVCFSMIERLRGFKGKSRVCLVLTVRIVSGFFHGACCLDFLNNVLFCVLSV
jgi:hypothetical protein